MKHCIGMDLGTSALKMTLVDETGKIVDTQVLEYPLILSKPGYSEQDPSCWVRALKDGLRNWNRISDIQGLVIDGQMHGLVCLDKDFEVIRPCILWNDSRSQKECDRLNEDKDFLLQETGNIAFPGFTLPKILWMKEHEKENFQKIRYVLLPKDYLNFVLTGNLYSDYSDASGTLALDVRNRTWSKKMIELTGLDFDCFPKIVETGTNIGRMKDDLRSELGLSGEIFVYQGAADNAAAAISNGVLAEGDCSLSLGTSGTIYLASDAFFHSKTGAIHSFLSGNGNYCQLACMLSAANCFKWFNDSVLKIEDYNKYQEEIQEDDLGKNEVYFLPYLMGERSPINDTKIRGAFVNLSLSTTAKEMTQAIFEGVAFGLKDSFVAIQEMGIQVKEAYITGGGSRSMLWKKIVSDVLDIPLHVLMNSYGPSYGMALVGLVSMKCFDSLESFFEKKEIKETIYPDKDKVALYEEKYETFKKIYPALKGRI